ncbi:hypothetical protein HanLR1_Chr00c3351g0876311 [Helianthus annuus]|nr:hypothetical protein HanLR1_Chr00c3351g0876311 [Helianthus annuus]
MMNLQDKGCGYCDKGLDFYRFLHLPSFRGLIFLFLLRLPMIYRFRILVLKDLVVQFKGLTLCISLLAVCFIFIFSYHVLCIIVVIFFFFLITLFGLVLSYFTCLPFQDHVLQCTSHYRSYEDLVFVFISISDFLHAGPMRFLFRNFGSISGMLG